MQASKLGMLASGFTALCLFACAPSSGVFVCSDDSECTGAGVGSCQANGYCAFPDAQCDSGLRFGEYAGGGFAQMCVPVDEGSTGGSSTSATSASTTTSTTDEPPLTTGMPSETSTESSSGTTDHGSSTTDAETTGGAPACVISFEDGFDEADLPGHWAQVGTGMVSASNGAARFRLHTDAGTIALRHQEVVPFEGAWFEVQVRDLSLEEAVRAFITLTTDDGVETVTLAIDSGGTTLTGLHLGESLFSISYDDAMPWLALREVDGRVLFELGASKGEWETIYEAEVDLRGASGWMEFGAENSEETPDEEVVSFDDAMGCVAER